MPQITTKELGLLADRLSYEETMVAKYRAYATEMSDSELKSKCEMMSEQHQTHLDTLYSYLK